MTKQVESSIGEFGPEVVVEVTSKIELIKKYGNTSGAIRGLFALGYTRVEIKNMLDIRYQHVRNVLITPIKRSSAL